MPRGDTTPNLMCLYRNLFVSAWPHPFTQRVLLQVLLQCCTILFPPLRWVTFGRREHAQIEFNIVQLVWQVPPRKLCHFGPSSAYDATEAGNTLSSVRE